MYELSVIIPARNEEFLAKTVEDLLQNIEGSTEIIIGCDGNWPDPPIPIHPDVTIIYYPESIGQRAMMNRCVRLSKAKYVLKTDAHCAFDKGFDVKMMSEMQPNWTMVPVMKNLHAFDWVCKFCGYRQYQGPKPEQCPECTGIDFEKDVVWIAKPSPNSTSYRFNKELHFKYFGEYKPKQIGDIVDTLSLQGSCFMCTREKYWELELCDESWGSWGQQGTEVSAKTHLSGGRVACNKKTWYAHMFRTQAGWKWPYPAPGSSQQRARQISQDIFLNNEWPKQKYPLSWLLKKFWPVPDWEQKDLDELVARETKQGWHGKPKRRRRPPKGVVYYTDNRIDEQLMLACQKQIVKGIKEKHVISVSLQPIEFGTNIHVPETRGTLTMFKQILAGLEASTADVIFLAEHDILYHPSHFDFIPPNKEAFYYNLNVWKVRIEDGHALKVDDCKQTSGLCAWRELLLEHYRKRVERVEKDGYKRNMGFEPGTHSPPVGIDNYPAESWASKYPNIDIRHDKNLTANRWEKSEFRNQKYTMGWTEADEVTGWGSTKELVERLGGNKL